MIEPNDNDSAKFEAMDEERRKQLLERIRKELAEEFDTVQIFVSRCSEDRTKTTATDTGLGNMYARRSQASQWLARMDERDRVNECQAGAVRVVPRR